MTIAEDAACKGKPPRWFFEDLWLDSRVSFTKGLTRARSYCNVCPVRGACLAMEMRYEVGMAESHRAGIYGGLTPAQRYSLEKRGMDYSNVDPIDLQDMIPDRGDEWAERHTILAREVIAWLVENCEPGAEVPSASKMSRTLTARVGDMRRIYEALRADQILRRTNEGILIRQATAASSRNWLPIHLR